MPFRSESQRKFLFANEPEVAKEFASKTPKGMKLPKRVKQSPDKQSRRDAVKEQPVPAGRPSDYCPKILEKVKKYFEEWEPSYDTPITITTKNGASIEKMEERPNGAPTAIRLAKAIGVSRATVFNWMNKHPEFLDLIKKGTNECFRTGMYENGLIGTWSAPMTIFLSKNLLGMTDRMENTNKFPEAIVFKTPDGKTIEKIDFKEPDA